MQGRQRWCSLLRIKSSFKIAGNVDALNGGKKNLTAKIKGRKI